jgi:hypothetical protein
LINLHLAVDLFHDKVESTEVSPYTDAAIWAAAAFPDIPIGENRMTKRPNAPWVEKMKKMRERLGRPLTLDELLGAPENDRKDNRPIAQSPRPLRQTLKNTSRSDG